MARVMKDSGVEWIGEIPVDWNIYKGKLIFKQRSERGNDVPVQLAATQKYGMYPQSLLDGVVQVNIGTDIQQFKTVHINDFVISLRSFQGGFEISDYEGVCSPAYQVFYSIIPINHRFYKYLFKSDGFISKMNSLTVGIREGKNIQYKDFSNSFVLYPSQKEQCAIASILDSKCQEIDNVLAKTRSSIEEYKKLKQAIITKAVTKGIRKNRKMKDSGIEWIGEIPEEWEIRKLSWLFSFIGGYAYNSNSYIDESNYQVLRIGNVKNLGIVFSASPVFINEKLAQETQNYKIKDNYILFTMTGTKRKRDYFYTYLVKPSDLQNKSLYINQRVGAFVSKRNCCPSYYSYLLKEDRILDSIFMYETGTANQGNLGIESINKTRLQFPPLEEQQEISEYLDSKCSEIDTLISKKEQLISELESYKKSLIYEYVTGKKEVPMV